MEKEKLLKESEVARLVDVSPYTLRNQRHCGRGPAYVKFGRAVRYRVSDIEKYIADRRIAHDEY